MFCLRMVFCCIFVLSGISAFAQGHFTVKLRLIDEKTSEPVGFATASLTPKGETTASKYVLTDIEPSFSTEDTQF